MLYPTARGPDFEESTEPHNYISWLTRCTETCLAFTWIGIIFSTLIVEGKIGILRMCVLRACLSIINATSWTNITSSSHFVGEMYCKSVHFAGVPRILGVGECAFWRGTRLHGTTKGGILPWTKAATSITSCNATSTTPTNQYTALEHCWAACHVRWVYTLHPEVARTGSITWKTGHGMIKTKLDTTCKSYWQWLQHNMACELQLTWRNDRILFLVPGLSGVEQDFMPNIERAADKAVNL